MGIFSGISNAVSGAWDGIKDAGGKLWDMGNAFSGSGIGNAIGSGASTAAQIAAMKYGYDKSLEGIEKQNATAKQMAQEANMMSQANAREQMAFQRRMSSDAHQREVIDLRRAGLNPILSGTGGMGASTTAGAQGDVKVAPVASEGQAVSSAMDVFRTVAQAMKTNADREFIQTAKTAETQASAKKMESETIPVENRLAKLQAEVRNLVSGTIKNLASADQIKAAEKATIAGEKNTEAHTRLLNMNLKQATAELARMLADEEIYSGEAGYWIRLIEKLAPAAGKIPGVTVKSLRR